MTAFLLAGCDSLPGRPTQADLPLRPSDVTEFATLYGENCAGCHGADGKSGAAIAMNNPIYLARKSWTGAPGAAEGAPPYSSSIAGDSSRGARVYATKCQSCHGPDGKGGPAAGSVVDASYLSLVSNQYLRTIVIAGRPDLGHPDWKHDAAGQALTPAQVSDVVAWLASKRPASSLAQSN